MPSPGQVKAFRPPLGPGTRLDGNVEGDAGLDPLRPVAGQGHRLGSRPPAGHRPDAASPRGAGGRGRPYDPRSAVSDPRGAGVAGGTAPTRGCWRRSSCRGSRRPARSGSARERVSIPRPTASECGRPTRWLLNRSTWTLPWKRDRSSTSMLAAVLKGRRIAIVPPCTWPRVARLSVQGRYSVCPLLPEGGVTVRPGLVPLGVVASPTCGLVQRWNGREGAMP